MPLDRVRHAWNMQRHNAIRRGIDFNFSYTEWCEWWKSQLGENWFELRGKGADKFHMARFGDTGAYEPGNVKPLTQIDNTRETIQNGTSQHGAKHWNNRLTPLAVLCIFHSRKSSEAIADQYGLHPMTPYLIWNKSRWKKLLDSLKRGELDLEGF